jgi:hypothetical protein
MRTISPAAGRPEELARRDPERVAPGHAHADVAARRRDELLGVELVHHLDEEDPRVVGRDGTRRGRRGRGRGRRQIARVAELLARGAVAATELPLELLERHRLPGVAGEGELAVEGRLHRVHASREHSVEHVGGEPQHDVAPALGGPEAGGDLSRREAQVELAAEVGEPEVERHLALPRGRAQGLGGGGAGEKALEERVHAPRLGGKRRGAAGAVAAPKRRRAAAAAGLRPWRGRWRGGEPAPSGAAALEGEAQHLPRTARRSPRRPCQIVGHDASLVA